MTKHFVLATLVGAFALTGCGDKAADGAASGSAATSAKPAGASASAAASSAPAAPKNATVAQFATEAPANVCKQLTSCKNEEVAVSIGSMLQLVAGFAGMGDPKVAEEMKGIGEAMKKDKRNLLNADECTKVMGVVTNTTGFDEKKLQAAIDAKKVEFNAEKAGACLAALASQPAFCKDEKKITGEPNLGELDKMMKTYEKDLDAHVKVCEEALVGKIAAGEACEADYECAGDKVGCKNKKCVAK